MSDLIKRGMMSAIIAPVGIWLIYQGSLFFFIPISIIILGGVWEYVGLLTHHNWRIPLWLVMSGTALQLIAAQWPDLALGGVGLAITLFAALLYALWLYEKEEAVNVTASWLATIGGVMLLGWMGSHFFLLRHFGWEWALLPIVVTWSADSGAYLAGRQFGRHKLAPRLSPKKTVEGYIGGLVAGMIAGWLTAFFTDIPLPMALIVALPVAALGTFGDLGMSLLKRETGIKDSGRMFLSHGGALDRLDSLLWAVTIAYYLLLFLQV